MPKTGNLKKITQGHIILKVLKTSDKELIASSPKSCDYLETDEESGSSRRQENKGA